VSGSSYIPDGLLPSRKGNEKEYTRIYHKLRRKYDPTYNWQGNERAKVAAEKANGRYKACPKLKKREIDPWKFPDED